MSQTCLQISVMSDVIRCRDIGPNHFCSGSATKHISNSTRIDLLRLQGKCKKADGLLAKCDKRNEQRKANLHIDHDDKYSLTTPVCSN